MDKSLITKKTVDAVHSGLRNAAVEMQNAIRDYNNTVVIYRNARERYEGVMIELLAKMIRKKCKRRVEVNNDRVVYSRKVGGDRRVSIIFEMGAEDDPKARTEGSFIISSFAMNTAHIGKTTCNNINEAVDKFDEFLKKVDKESEKCRNKKKRR